MEAELSVEVVVEVVVDIEVVVVPEKQVVGAAGVAPEFWPASLHLGASLEDGGYRCW